MCAAASDHSRKPDKAIDPERVIVLLDQSINTQVNAIMQTPQFIAAECLWRGLQLLVTTLPQDSTVRLKILPVSWHEITQDCSRCEFDHTWLFELIYNQEFAMPGGEPFGLLIGDYLLGPDLQGTEHTESTLSALASISAAAFCPFMAGAAPSATGLSDYQDLNRLPDLISLTSDTQFIRWNALRQQEETRFLGLVAPRILLRSPYKSADCKRQDGFAFEEKITADGATLRWGNGAFAFALNVIQNFIRHGWFSELHGIRDQTLEGGYIDEDILPPYKPPDEIDPVLRQPPVEIRLTTDQQQQFCALGIIPVATSYLLQGLVFNASQSLFLPDNRPFRTMNENMALSAMLQYVLCVSRFAHCLKVIMRSEIGNYVTREALETRLQDWLLTYTLAGFNHDTSLRARYPLRASRVCVTEVAGRPGLFSCVLDLQPHLYLDSLHATFRLLIDAPVLPSGRPAQEYAA